MKLNYLLRIIALASFALVLSSIDAVGQERAAVQIDSDFPGGNIIVDSVSPDGIVTLQPDLRDTEGDWFYTAFRVRNAQGQKLTFQFTTANKIGPRGPAVSSDAGATWRFLSTTPDADSQRFEYAFAPEENETYFALCPLYTRANWLAFLERFRNRPEFLPGVLCQARDGSDVDMLEITTKDGKTARFAVAMTARHHCCEAVASFVLEGVLEGVMADDQDGEWLRENCRFFIVPMVDEPGVEAGDQGKNRRPHDHNRDYAQEIYPSVRALKAKIVADFAETPLVFLDWHDPWIRGGEYNERIYAPASDDENATLALKEFSLELEREQRGKTLPYEESYNLPFGVAWNTNSNYERPDGERPTLSSKYWAITLPNTILATTYEIPYANASDVEVTPEAAREFGRSAARALRRYLQKQDETNENPSSPNN